MKKTLSLFLVLSLFLSSCSTIKDYASQEIENTFDSIGVKEAAKPVKKVILSEEKWDDDDSLASIDIIYNAGNSQKYLDNLLKMLLEFSESNEKLYIYMLRTARVQGLLSWGMDIKITRGMFNMIYDEAELACLIGHEIGHSALKHSEKKKDKNEISDFSKDITNSVLNNSRYRNAVKKQQKKLIKTGWNRNQEKEADRYGAELAANAGYDPYAFCDLFERLSQRVDLGFFYNFKKLEGTHPGLDERAKSLREYLQKRGYKEGEGKRNRKQYVEGVSDLLVIRTGEDGKDAKKIKNSINEEGKKDLSRLNEIFKEVKPLQKTNKSISMDRFIEIMDEVSQICQKYGIEVKDVFGNVVSVSDNSFMEESIVQDSPFWEMFADIKEVIAEKVGDILSILGRVAIGATPVVGDVVDIYELISGKDFFTGEKLTVLERYLSAFGLLVGSGSSWRAIAKGVDNELIGFTNRVAAKNIFEARSILKNTIKDVEVSDNWKRLNSVTANKGADLNKLPYRSGMRAYEGVTKNNEVFYRVYSNNNIESSWVVKFDPTGMNANELKEFLALPKAPTHIAKVEVPAGTRIRVGNASENIWGSGGLVQWQIILEQGKSYKDAGILFKNSGKL